MRILSNSAKFSAGLLLLPAHIFLATMASTYNSYRLGLWPPYNFWRLKTCLELRYSCVLSTRQSAAGDSRGNPTG